jgi:hypothetical protein
MEDAPPGKVDSWYARLAVCLPKICLVLRAVERIFARAAPNHAFLRADCAKIPA